MALDFSNRNPQDPNGIYSLDTASAQDVWLKDDDWSTPYYDAASARKAGANNKVRMATAITNDGKKYNVVIGANGQPISQIGDTVGQDDDVAKRWQQNAPKPLPPGGTPTQRRQAADGLTHIYGYNSATGQYDIDQGAVEGQQAKPPETKDEGGRRYQWQPNPGGPTAGGKWIDVGPAPLSAAEQAQQPQSTRTPDKDHPGVYVVTSKNPQTGLTETHYENAEGTTIPAPAETPKDTPTVITRNGATYIQHTTPGVNGKPGEIYYTDQQGNRVQLPNEPSKGTPAEPAGAPPASTDYGQISASLVRYRDFLNKQTQLFKDTGGREGLSPEDADKLMQARLTQAASAMAEQQGVVNTQTGIYGQQITEAQNERTDANNRRTQANSAYSTVMQSFVPLLKYMPEGGGQAFLDLLAHGMGAARQNAADWGGMKETPAPTLGPAAATANAAPMPGTQGTFLAGAIPPNAIGAGSIGAVPAPGAPIGQVAAGVTATNAAAVNPTGANVQAATDATMQGSNAAFGALGVPAQQATPPAVNPAAGEPGHNPNAPVGMLPGQGGMADRLLLPDDPNAPQPQISPEQVQALMSRTGMQGVRQGPDVYDGNSSGSFLAPYQGQQQQPSALDQLLSDPSIPNHIVARAYEQVYGVPLSSYGMS